MAARLTAVHRHPSLHCYKNHKCRCRECCFIGSQYMKNLRATHRRLGRKPGRELLPRKKGGNVLPPDEVTRLRRAVGLE
jgi:hypothetical protein